MVNIEVVVISDKKEGKMMTWRGILAMGHGKCEETFFLLLGFRKG